MEDMTSKPCLKCCLKHLAAAIVELKELESGYWGGVEEIQALGDLDLAARHLLTIDPKLSDLIRKQRIDIFDALRKVMPYHFTSLQNIWQSVNKLAVNGGVIPAATQKGVINKTYEQITQQIGLKDLSKPCGCGAKSKAITATVASSSSLSSSSVVAQATPVVNVVPMPLKIDYGIVISQKAGLIRHHPELAPLYAKAEAAIRINPKPRQANFEHAYAAIVEKVKALK